MTLFQCGGDFKLKVIYVFRAGKRQDSSFFITNGKYNEYILNKKNLRKYGMGHLIVYIVCSGSYCILVRGPRGASQGSTEPYTSYECLQ